MLVLGIETSCDETSAAIVEASGRVRSNVIHSQVAVHAPHGGIVPELASRDHVRNITRVVDEALSAASLEPSSVDLVAVTHRPGLVGALLVGVEAAKGLSFALGKPLVGVDHLAAHLLSCFLFSDEIPKRAPNYPFVALLVSGGHTALYAVTSPMRIEELGATRDDAAGEAFDKVAKMLGLGYPGGPILSHMAERGDNTRVKLTEPLSGSLEFSFSGLKTQVSSWIKAHAPLGEQDRCDVAASFQRMAVRSLTRKLMAATERVGVSSVVVAGGVAANRTLRHEVDAACKRVGKGAFFPPLSYCTDNAAMVGYAGALRFLAEGGHDLALSVESRTGLPRRTRKGRGDR